jgi:hypothetical protein
MLRPVLFALVTFTAVTVVGSAAAQVPANGRPPATGPRGLIRVDPGQFPPVGFPPDGNPMVPDFRLWLRGLNKVAPPKDVDPKLLKDLMDQLNKLPKGEGQPVQKEDIEKLLEKNPQFKNPAFVEPLKELAKDPDFPKKLESKLPDDAPPIQNHENLKEKLEQVIEEANNRPADPQVAPKGDPVNPPKVEPPTTDPTKTDPKAPGPASENEWAKWLEKNFGDSPAGQAALKDLMSALEKQDMKGMFDQVPEFKNGAWKDMESWGKANTGEWKIKPPDLSGNKVTSPKIGGGSGGTSSGGGGGGSSGFGGGGAGFGGGWSALAVIVGIAGAILLVILLLRKWKLNQAERAAAGAAGRRGIDFDSIRTREQLVRAFDHVSLDQIGDEARSWNHQVIADQFAESRPAQAEPAGELAELYERARYAPLDEDLTAGEFADARRDLRVIAGATA